MKERAIVTVLVSLNQTTMPYNEFILFRNKNFLSERQMVLLTLNEIAIPQNDIPSELYCY